MISILFKTTWKRNTADMVLSYNEKFSTDITKINKKFTDLRSKYSKPKTLIFK